MSERFHETLVAASVTSGALDVCGFTCGRKRSTATHKRMASHVTQKMRASDRRSRKHPRRPPQCVIEEDTHHKLRKNHDESCRRRRSSTRLTKDYVQCVLSSGVHILNLCCRLCEHTSSFSDLLGSAGLPGTPFLASVAQNSTMCSPLENRLFRISRLVVIPMQTALLYEQSTESVENW